MKVTVLRILLVVGLRWHRQPKLLELFRRYLNQSRQISARERIVFLVFLKLERFYVATLP